MVFSTLRSYSSPRLCRCHWCYLYRQFFGLPVFGGRVCILCVPTLFCGVYGSGRLGSQVSQGKNFLFSLIGQNSEGMTVAQNFIRLKRTISKKTKKGISLN